MNSIILKILILTWFALFPIAANIEAFNAWSFLIGVVFIAIPILILTWSEKGSEANRIAHQLAIDAESFLKEERDKVGYSFLVLMIKMHLIKMYCRWKMNAFA